MLDKIDELADPEEVMCPKEDMQWACVGCSECAPEYWQADLCTAQLGGDCTGCGECRVEDCVDTCPQEGM